MSQEGESNPIKNNEDDDLDIDAENLFKEVDAQESEKQQQKKPKKLKKIKKEKKSKKDKKKKKKRRRQQQQQDDYGLDEEEDDDQQINSMFDEEAESDDQENYSDDRGEAEIGQQQENDRFNEMMNKPSTRDQYFRRFEGKNDREINAQYSRGANMLRQNQAMYPGESDPKIYVVNVKPRHEDELVFNLLNKARYLAQKTNKVTVVTATSLRKKYSGRVFVQAFSEKDLRDSLEGFNFVMLSKNIHQLDREDYAQLFNEKHENKVAFEQDTFVRISKGLYAGDVAKIVKIKANSAQVLVVPRLNIQQIAMKIRQHTSKITDEKVRQEKKAELLTLFLNYKSNNFKTKPNKQPLTRQQVEQQFGDNPAAKKIRLVQKPTGLLLLNYRFDQIMKNEGTLVPAEIMPFTTQGNFIGRLNQQKANLTVATSYKKGEQVQIVAGTMMGHRGVIFEIRDNIAVIVCKNKQLKNQKIEQQVQNIAKKFKQGQRVKVISGADTGKSGIILKVQVRVCEIWTDNQNSIRVNKINLQVSKQQMICQQNVHKLKKDDLIKTSKNQIGLVIQTSKDNIKMLDTNNNILTINNMDFDSKLNTKNIVAKNKSGDQISAGSLVIIRHGAHEGKKCKVIHVYRQNVFLFNATFNKASGKSVQNAQNCSLISKNQPTTPRNISIKGNSTNIGSNDKNQDQITIGQKITLRSGPLKGYLGIVKSINKDKIQVRVPSKSCIEWVPRQNVTAKQQTMDIGKTPNRRVGNTHNYVPSPTRY